MLTQYQSWPLHSKPFFTAYSTRWEPTPQIEFNLGAIAKFSDTFIITIQNGLKLIKDCSII
jgi:hypothetical protein